MIDVVGVPAAGLESLDEPTRALVLRAPVVVGSPRLLALLPHDDQQHHDQQHHGQHHLQRRVAWPSPLRAGLPALFQEVGTVQVVVLATGDPLLSGVGTTLVEVLGAEVVRIHPAVSSVALARARMRWSAEQSTVVSLVSTPASAVRLHLVPGARLVILSAGAKTPGEVAAQLVDAGWPQAEVTVLAALGSSEESTRSGSAADWLDGGDPARQLTAVPPLNIVAVRLPTEHTAYGTTPGLPTSAFDHDGQVTKSQVRAAALAALRPMPGQLLWDLGAGAGSVGIEWARAARGARTIAVERNPERAERIRRNAAALGVPQVQVVQAATDVVTTPAHGLPHPDAVFVGGGASEQVIAAAWEALRPHGRIVVHAVTLETEALAVAAFREHGGELRRLTVERAEPLGSHLSWTPARPVVQWSCTKETRETNEGPL